jgi:hypothetical protein
MARTRVHEELIGDIGSAVAFVFDCMQGGKRNAQRGRAGPRNKPETFRTCFSVAAAPWPGFQPR